MTKSDTTAQKAAATVTPKVLVVPRPTPDQLEFLRGVNLTPATFDRSIVVGGPARSRRSA